MEEEKKSEFISEGEERKKKLRNWEHNKIIEYKATITMYIYTVIVASLDIYKVIQGLMHVFFILYCGKFCTFCSFRPIDAIALR